MRLLPSMSIGRRQQDLRYGFFFGTGGLDCYQLSWKPKNIVKVSVLVIFSVRGNFHPFLPLSLRTQNDTILTS